MTLSREQLLADIAHADEKAASLCGACAEDHARLAGYMRRLLAAEAQEPVAWRCDSGSIANRHVVTVHRTVAESWVSKSIHVTPLFAAPQPVAVPDKMTYQDGVVFVLNNGMASIERGTVAMRAWNACRAAALNQTRVNQTLVEPVRKPYKLPQLSDAQCLEFLSVAFRHSSISGDIELDDIRLGLKMALAAAPQEPAK